MPSRPAVRTLVVLLVVAMPVVIARAASAQTTSPTPSPGPIVGETQDQVMLSGSLLVPRGQSVGEVVVLHGRASVYGVAVGDVVVVDGPTLIAGQVSGSVIALNGPIRLTRTASVRGDVLGSQTVRVDPGATVQGDVRQSVAFTPRDSLKVLGILLGSISIAVSALLLLVLLLLLAPRASNSVAASARDAPFASFGWGLLSTIVLPLVSVLAAVTVLGLPLGLSVLLGLALIFMVGYAWAVWAVGRALVREPRSGWLALLTGWGISLAVSLVPFLNVAAWTVGSIFGLGAMIVATWRARGLNGAKGKHRAGYVALPEAEPAPAPQESGSQESVPALASDPSTDVAEPTTYPATSDD
jgi:hypothetical protein